MKNIKERITEIQKSLVDKEYLERAEEKRKRKGQRRLREGILQVVKKK